MSMTTTPTDPVTPPDGGLLAPRPGSAPADRCYRCGQPTPAGIGVCGTCNPGRVKGPSAWQLHATIFLGVVLGAVGLFVGWRFMITQGGPYTAVITQRSMGADGAPAIAITVANDGIRSGVANCRVTRDGAPRPEDPVFRTERIEPEASVVFAPTVPAPPVTAVAYDLDRLTVVCT